MNTNAALKYRKVVFVTIISILLNIGGKTLAEELSLPLWLDAFGTCLAAYILGPFGGAAVGFSGNFIYGIINSKSLVYGITNIIIGIIVGIAARKKRFDGLYTTLKVNIAVTFASVVVSTPFNIFLYGGETGNIWGDGVTEFLMLQGAEPVLAYVMGEFYIDFLDKLITLVMLYLGIKLFRYLRKDKPFLRSISTLSIFALFFFLLSVSAFAKTDTHDFHSYIRTLYNGENGLTCGKSNAVAQTNDGIIWIGTYAGLYRYNGIEMRIMTEFDSVKNVNCLYVDEEGRLLIGTNDNGLSISINGKIANVLDKKTGLPSNAVRSITQCSDGHYYVGTVDALQIIELNSGLKLVRNFPEINSARSLSSDKNGHVAAVTSMGDMYLLLDDKVLTSDFLKNEDIKFTCCKFAPDGTLYVGTSENKIYTYSIEQNVPKFKDTYNCEGLDQINSLYFADDEILFVCADNGIGYLTKNGEYSDISPTNFKNSVENMTVDYQGSLWFTSSRLGLLRMSESIFSDIYAAANIEGHVVNTVYKKGDILYVGTDDGLQEVDISKKEEFSDSLTQLLTGVRIRSIIYDKNNNMWICTYGKGLMEVSPDGNIRHYDSSNGFCDRVRVVLELKDGSIASAGDKGLIFIKGGDIQKFLRYGEELENSIILCLLECSDGSLLAGFDGDGMTLIKDGKAERTFSDTDGLTSGVILRIVSASDKSGYFIVASNGLCFMDNGRKIKALDKFPYYDNYDIVHVNNGKVFVLGSAGIHIANEDDVLKNTAVPECEILDGKKGLVANLTANAWNFTDADGTLYLPCSTGVYSININDLYTKTISYRMKLSNVKLDDSMYRIERGTPISADRSIKKIEFFPEIINYTAEDPYVSYCLEGYDTQDTVMPCSKLTSITYTNIPSGEYTFRLKILDAAGKTLEESSFLLVKERKIYDNVWFILYMQAVAVLAIMCFTWFIVRTWYQRTLDLRNKELDLARKQLQMGNETILAIAKSVDAKDENTSQHSQRVSDYSVMIAKELGFDEKECENLRKAALLHDIGKIGIPDNVLKKPSRLTDEEYALMKTHVTKGADILKDFTLVDHVIDGALYHHERYDGKGYVHGLMGEEIPLYGRIIGVADAFDAMTQNRVYRKKLDLDFVIGELKRCRGTQFDPNITDIMLKLIDSGKISFSEE